jgi:transposase
MRFFAMRIAPPIVLLDEEKEHLRSLIQGRTTEQRVVMRARIVLLAGEGWTNEGIAEEVRVSVPTAGLWRTRFIEGRITAILSDAPRPGRPRRITDKKACQIIEATLHSKPKNATHWSSREMARTQGVSQATVIRIWNAHSLKPHIIENFKFSKDPNFIEKVEDVVGLYMNPPDKAIVFSVDEKSQIQALDRTQLQLPIRRGIPARQPHDYKRHGTTTLFAALNLLDGTLIGKCHARHRHQEFIKFLKLIDRETPEKLDLHIILDNYATHKHKNVKDWLNQHKRFHLHFVPTSSSWLNLVERWFGELTERRIRRGTFQSVADLETAIREYMNNYNQNPHQFTWTKNAVQILEKIVKLKAIYDSGH